MKTFIICTAMAIFGALSHAAPFEAVRRQESVEVTFRGAPPDVAFFKQSFPTDGSFVYICASICPSVFLYQPRLSFPNIISV
jgi:hypothetical protein